MMSSPWIDISMPLSNGMVHWPGDEPFHREQMLFLERGDACNLSKIETTVHVGTHMDAPFHFVPGGPGIDTMPLNAGIGRARIIAISNPSAITVDEIAPHNISKGERILFRTRNSEISSSDTEFKKNFVSIAHEAAEYLAGRGVLTVGVDYLSVGAFEGDGAETHRALLGNGVWIIEGLRLGDMEPGEYDLICLPLKLAGSDGAPARAVLRKP
jgi:arylformamidase